MFLQNKMPKQEMFFMLGTNFVSLNTIKVLILRRSHLYYVAGV
jgi:hypothetical protein